MEKNILERVQKAILEEGLDGWLFWNFHHRDPLSDEILGLSPVATNSRPWLYAVPSKGEPVKIVHAIEAGILDTLPGQKRVYAGRDSFLRQLSPLSAKRWGVHTSPEITVLSYMDAGTAETLTQRGLILVPALALIQRFKGLLSERGIESHERAAAHLYQIVDQIWDRLRHAYRNGHPLREGDLRDEIVREFENRSLITDHPPIVAAGKNAGNPHYDFSDAGKIIERGAVIQLDLWAKEKADSSIYADISWVGVFADGPQSTVERAFSDLVAAREGALDFISAELRKSSHPSGAQVDQITRNHLIDRGYEGALRHRTGHGIDTECHGSGVNIDSVEFPDPRLLLEGSCFSLEPGIYFDTFGLRTEIDVYIHNGQPKVSGGNRQFSLLTCGPA